MKLMSICGLIYLMSGAWCLLQADLAAAGIGFQFATLFAKSEFIVVYGGLQIGIGLAMSTCARVPAIALGASVFSLIFSSVLLFTRFVTYFYYGASEMWMVLFCLELAIVVALGFSVRQIAQASKGAVASLDTAAN